MKLAGLARGQAFHGIRAALRPPRRTRETVRGRPGFFFPALLSAACGGSGERQPLLVFAASSLADAFGEMEAVFEADRPETDLRFVFAGSHVLKMQIEEGAEADIFASADRRHVESLARGGFVGGYHRIAENELTVIVPASGSSDIGAFADLPRAARLVIATPAAPLGGYTRAALERSAAVLGRDFERAVLDRVVSQEGNARLVRAKVEMGVADAAIVYRTDAQTEKVRAVPLPKWANVRAAYLMAALDGTPRPAAARRWTCFVAKGPGREILLRHRFLLDERDEGGSAEGSCPES